MSCFSSFFNAFALCLLTNLCSNKLLGEFKQTTDLFHRILSSDKT